MFTAVKLLFELPTCCLFFVSVIIVEDSAAFAVKSNRAIVIEDFFTGCFICRDVLKEVRTVCSVLFIVFIANGKNNG